MKKNILFDVLISKSYIKPEEAKERLESENGIVVLDVRTQ
jgi:hypothetical protein